MAEELSELKTDVALIKKDVKQIERFFGKFESALDTMAEMSKQVAVQGEVLKNTSDKLHDLEERMSEHRNEDKQRTEILTNRLEAYRKSSYDDHQRLANESRENRKERNEEIMSELHKMNGALDKRLTKLDERINILENWKWYMMGISAILVFIAANMQWSALFG